MASSSRMPHLLSLIKSLPATPLRPAGSPQLSNALEAIVNRVSSPSAASSSASTSGVGTSGSIAQSDPVESMIGALERLKANEARDQFTLTSRTLRPAHDPHYYKRMTDGVHRAAQGQGRSWWKTFFQIKGDA